MCALFGISRSAFYAWARRRLRPDPDRERMTLVQEAFQRSHQTYGYRRIVLWVRQQKGVHLNGKAVRRLMNKLELHPQARRRRIYRALEQIPTEHTYPNRLGREFQAAGPNQKWVTDVTYIQTRQGWAYLAVIRDLFDGFIVAHQLSRQNSIGLVTQTLQRAREREQPRPGLLLHSDQGMAYRSHAYHVLLKGLGITPSMSRRGNCWDNAPMENFFGHLKEEALRGILRPSFEQVRQIIDEYVDFFNYERIQLKSGQTPHQLRCLSA